MTGFYQLSRVNRDIVYYGASALRHEQQHLFRFGEERAFQVQDQVFHQFENFFRNKQLYGALDNALHQAIRENNSN